MRPTYIIDGKGNSKKIDFNFTSYNEATGWATADFAEVEASCSLVWKGMMYVFGGQTNGRRQISLVDKCQLRSIGKLQFDMIYGACAQNDNKEMYICFENTEKKPETAKTCRRSTGPLQSVGITMRHVEN